MQDFEQLQQRLGSLSMKKHSRLGFASLVFCFTSAIPLLCGGCTNIVHGRSAVIQSFFWFVEGKSLKLNFYNNHAYSLEHLHLWISCNVSLSV